MIDYGKLAIDSALDTIGVTHLRQQAGFANLDGRGVTTVVIDTGIDLDHSFFGPDLNGDGVDDRIVYQYDFAEGDADASDFNGHGSNVASLIGSQHALYRGVASGTDLIALKVFEDSGRGYFSYLEQALQWVLANHEAYHIGVVNLSLGDGGNWTDDFSRYGLGDEFAALAKTDVIVVAAAGNNYRQFGRMGVAYPGSDPAVIAIGATWAADFGGPWTVSTGATNYATGVDQIAAFSQRDTKLLDAFVPGARFNGANATGGIVNTGERFQRMNFERLAGLIATLGDVTPGDGGEGGGSGGTVTPSELAAAGVHTVTLSAGAEAAGNDFGNFELVDVSGTKFNDANANGLRDAGEAGLGGWTITLDKDGDGTLDGTTVTAADGSYSFAALGPGHYVLGEVMQPGWTQTAPAGGSYGITTASGQDIGGRDFGNRFDNHAPTANADGPYIADFGGTVTLDGTGSFDPDVAFGDSIVSYEWLVGGHVAASGARAQLTAEQVNLLGLGQHAVELRVVDEFGAIGSATSTLTVYNNEPNAAFSANHNPAAPGQFILFDASASSHGRPDRQIVSYLWDFGDGSAGASGLLVSHAYNAFGTYTVKLTVTDDNVPAKSDNASVEIAVNQGNRAPVANADGPYFADLGGTFFLDGRSSVDPDAVFGDSIVSYEWLVGGRLAASGGRPEFTAGQVNLLGAGVHAVELRVVDEFGLVGSASSTLTVYNNEPTASFTATPNPGAPAQLIYFDASASTHGRPDRTMFFAWDFGDGSPVATGMTAQHAYSAFGTYAATLTVTDNNVPAKTDTASATILVDQGNRAPVANADGPYTVDVGATVMLDGRGSSDPDAAYGDAIVRYDWLVGGTIALTGATPQLSAAQVSLLGAGLHGVQLTVGDTFGLTGTTSSTLTVNAAGNHAPVNSVPGTQTLDEDAALVFSAAHGNGLSVFDADVGTSLAVNLRVEHGVLTLGSAAGLVFHESDGDRDATISFFGLLADVNAALEGLRYEPDANFNGSDTLTLNSFDGALGDTDAVALTIQPMNDAPVARDDFYAVVEDGSLSNPQPGILANDTDVDGDTLSVSDVLFTQPFHGFAVVTFNSGVFSYNSNTNNPAIEALKAGQFLEDSFTYTVSDGHGGSDTALVTLRVTGVNDAPVAVDDSVSTDEDTSLIINALANDRDVDDPLHVSVFTQGAHGSVVQNTDGTFTYNPNANFHGTDSFQYTLSDGQLSDTATVSITVNPVNDNPVAADDLYTVVEDGSLSNPQPGILANDTDVDGDTLSVSDVLFTQPFHGFAVVTLNSGVFSYTSNTNNPAIEALKPGQFLDDSFTYTVSDGHGGTDTATVTLRVTGVNDAPIAADDSATTDEDVAVTIAVLANDR